MSSAEKAKIRKWILLAVASVKGSNGVTIQHIKKFLDTKQDGLSMKPETKLILKRLLETGHLKKKDGKYVIKKSKKMAPSKETKKVKSPLRKANQGITKKPKATAKKPSQLQEAMNSDL
ncbi:hypothetical protein HNY73_016559 [Argiope bruennichi]|uniref:H15 domain-containing protein n=1 Tax=Argiope bruennichi TaxID=94029 RepID=A0A8T0EKJ2_ARGBR|nr:hypothetical protein HNY73_016559 [Argiope bruennichi]